MDYTQIVNAWLNGKSGHSARGNGGYYRMSTDGQFLYSNHKPIGRTLEDGTKQVLGLTGYYAVSSSTSNHVRHAMRGIKWNDENIIMPTEDIKQSKDYVGGMGSAYQFPKDSSIVYVRNTIQVWKTRQEAEKHATISQIVQPVYGGYSVFYKQYVNSIGKVVSDAEYWAEMRE